MIGDKVYTALQSNGYSCRDKIKLCIYFTAIKDIFSDGRSAGRARTVRTAPG